ncbi:MAG: hypothetical protein RLY40_304 [Pseudomonadota bacterium]|jgi:exopolyphosphatase/pppGpp-phosphohydrolase
MPTTRDLKIILKIASMIEAEISEFISQPYSHEKLLKKLQELHIPEFKAQTQKILGLFNSFPHDHEFSKLIVLLGNINTKFISIEKLIGNSSYKTKFFKDNFTEQLQNHLKTIREEFNKLDSDNEYNQSLSFKPPTYEG